LGDGDDSDGNTGDGYFTSITCSYWITLLSLYRNIDFT